MKHAALGRIDEMVSAWRFSIFRFSLRTLFLGITAVCIFLGYQWEWVRRRRKFYDEHACAYLPESGARSLIEGRSLAHAPELLWMFNEPGYRHLSFIVKDDLMDKGRDWLFIS